MKGFIDSDFLEQNGYMWNKQNIEKLLKELNLFKSQQFEETQERCFVEWDFEIRQAIRILLQKLKELPLIVKCRTKGDSTEHFVGMEYSEFLRSLKISCDKYLRATQHKEDAMGSVSSLASKIRHKALAEEPMSKEIEKTLRNEYLSSGVDNTLNQIAKDGYDLNNLNFNDFNT